MSAADDAPLVGAKLDMFRNEAATLGGVMRLDPDRREQYALEIQKRTDAANKSRANRRGPGWKFESEAQGAYDAHMKAQYAARGLEWDADAARDRALASLAVAAAINRGEYAEKNSQPPEPAPSAFTVTAEAVATAEAKHAKRKRGRPAKAEHALVTAARERAKAEEAERAAQAEQLQRREREQAEAIERERVAADRARLADLGARLAACAERDRAVGQAIAAERISAAWQAYERERERELARKLVADAERDRAGYERMDRERQYRVNRAMSGFCHSIGL
jgi:hypothetical protein